MTPALLATIAAAAAILLAWLWRPRARLAPAARTLLVVYALLGGWALWFGLYSAPGQEPAELLLWKPTIMYWLLAVILFVAPSLGSDYPVKIVLGSYFLFSSREWRWINVGFAVLLTILGAWNLLVAFNASHDDWEGFKWSCMANVVAVFLLRLSFVWLEVVARVFKYLYGRAKIYFS